MFFLIAVNALTFLALAVLHIYWALGGQWGWQSTLPTKPDGKILFKPGTGATFVVAFGLLVFATITIGNFGVVDPWIDRRYVHIGMWIIIFIFFLRAIGDFKFIGFTKKIKHTPFAINDNKIYSPLCLGIAFVSFLILVFR